MSEFKSYVPYQADSRIIDVFKEAFVEIQKTNVANNLAVSFNTIAAQNPFRVTSLTDFDNPNIQNLSQDSSHLIISASISFSSFNITYNRTPTQLPVQFHISELIIINNSSLDPVVSAQIFKNIDLGFHLSFEPNKNDNPSEAHGFILSKLESLNVDIQASVHKRMEILEQDFIQRTKVLEEKFNTKEESLKQRYSSKEAALVKKEKELDSRSNTHARRDLRKDLTISVKDQIENFKLTTTSNRQFFGIHFTFISLLIISFSGVFYYSYQSYLYFQSENFDPKNFGYLLSIVKSVGLTLLFSTTVVFYLKWMIAWFNKLSEEELRLRRFQLDIDRSSWIVETVLESISQHKQHIPNELIMKFTSNLFESIEKTDEDQAHPVDALASAILGSSANVKIRVGDNEMMLDRRSLKNLER